MASEVKYSVVIPVFNTHNSLFDLHKRVLEVFQKLQVNYEIIFVNDASTNQETEKTIKKLSESDPKTIAVNLIRNYGQHAATLCGFQKAQGDFIITLDDDLQHAPEDIPALLEKKEHDIVIASFNQDAKSFKQRTLSSIKSRLDVLLFKKPINLELTAFRVLKKHIVKKVLESPAPYPYLPAMFFATTQDIVNVKVDQKSRKEGISGYSTRKTFKIFTHLLLNKYPVLLKGAALVRPESTAGPVYNIKESKAQGE